MSPIHKGHTSLASAHDFDRFALPQPIVRFGLSFANEKLQALFTKTVFEETLKAYAADGIEAAEITFVDGGNRNPDYQFPSVQLPQSVQSFAQCLEVPVLLFRFRDSFTQVCRQQAPPRHLRHAEHRVVALALRGVHGAQRVR